MKKTEPIRDKKALRQLAVYWLKRGNFRNYALIVLGVSTALRIGDLLSLTWSDVYDEERRAFRSHIFLKERKTGKKKQIPLSKKAVKALWRYYPHRSGDFIFANNRKSAGAICREHAWRIIRAATEALGLAFSVGCHGLRKSFGFFAWKAGVLPVLLMELFNHSSFEITRLYLGITQAEMDRVYLGMALF